MLSLRLRYRIKQFIVILTLLFAICALLKHVAQDANDHLSQKRYFGASKADNFQILGWINQQNRCKKNCENKTNKYTHLKISQAVFDRCYSRGTLDPLVYPCTYTDDDTQLSESQAVLFRGRHLSDMPLPSYRTKDQHWIFWEHEPPYKVWKHVNLTQYNGLFNLTATYTTDSDIPRPILLKHCVKSEEKASLIQAQKINYALKKRKDALAAWFVSQCESQSLREEYVRELRKHMKVHIYGKCGERTCGSTSTWSSDKCNENLLHQNNSYKFYLAFENSLCDEYITEKLWKLMDLDVVPVVMGSVNYSYLLPKDSFIDVKDFESPFHLAQYLKKVDEDDNLYNQYIRNKNSLICKNMLTSNWLCILCKRMHELRHQHNLIHRLDQFWGDQRCHAPKHI